MSLILRLDDLLYKCYDTPVINYEVYAMDNYFDIAAMIIAILTTIAAITPTKKDDSVVERIGNLLKIVRRK